ncbi:5,10-methenyltetrahydromethanopterin hydrogenase family protein, partial [Methanocaldococcus sp.]|uniref:5,10-methenyltetrahydromethanopterin hydrogenase family protein n=1 Tax=Methanocaldococcus sp. TaxID=2152917 RepID=UPI002639A1EC
VNKKPYVAPADVVPVVADMGVLVTAIALAGILDYYSIGTRVIKAPKKMIEKQVFMTLQTMASIVETSGIKGLIKALNPELLVQSAYSMKLENNQKELDAALELLPIFYNELKNEVENVEVKPIKLIAAQSLVEKIMEELKRIIGENAAKGIFKRSLKRLMEKYGYKN